MTMMRFVLILLLVICSLVARTQQQPEEEIFSTQCEGSTCLECADKGCGWVQTGDCMIDCVYVADIACYSNETVPNAQTSADVCNAYERYLNDTRICDEAGTDCSTCVATLQSDGTSPCQWYPITQSCWTGACNQLGCGTTTCAVGGDDNDGGGSFLSCSSSGASTCLECIALEDDCVWNSLTNTCVIKNGTLSDSAFSTTCDDDVLGNVTTGAPAATPAPSTASIGGGNAGAISSCEECLEQDYAWALGECLTSCSVIADASCYSTQYFGNKTAAEICEIESNNTADANLCQMQTDCVSCTNTTKSDGSSNCAWYVDGTSSWCGTGGCNNMFGVCGSSDCMVSDDVIPSQPPATSNMLYCSSAPNATTCEECVEADCAWTIGECWSSCSVIADASCYSTEYFANKTAVEICEIERNTTADADLCELQTDCSSCTNTTKSDGSSKCGWYVDGESSWCGTGDCNMFGICGSSNCSSVSLSQPPSTTSASFHMFAIEQAFSLILCCVALIL